MTLTCNLMFLSLKVWRARISGGTKAPFSHSCRGGSWHLPLPTSTPRSSLPSSSSVQWGTATADQLRAQPKFKITNFYLFICFYNSPSSTVIKGNLKWNCSLRSRCKEKCWDRWKQRGTTGFVCAPDHPKWLSITAPFRIRHFQIVHRVKR